MWETAAIVEVLERKGPCTKQDLDDIIPEFRRKNPAQRS
jgi:glutathione S-transferase